MNTIKMLITMIKGLFKRGQFDSREDFWDWYWEQIPDSRYPNETLYETWDTFKWMVTCGPVRYSICSWVKCHFGKKNYGYSYTFNKDGYFIMLNGSWRFFPNDKSFTEGTVCYNTEHKNGNPLFI